MIQKANQHKMMTLKHLSLTGSLNHLMPLPQFLHRVMKFRNKYESNFLGGSLRHQDVKHVGNDVHYIGVLNHKQVVWDRYGGNVWNALTTTSKGIVEMLEEVVNSRLYKKMRLSILPMLTYKRCAGVGFFILPVGINGVNVYPISF